MFLWLHSSCFCKYAILFYREDGSSRFFRNVDIVHVLRFGLVYLAERTSRDKDYREYKALLPRPSSLQLQPLPRYYLSYFSSETQRSALKTRHAPIFLIKMYDTAEDSGAGIAQAT